MTCGSIRPIAGARRFLFLVDTRNLGEQAEQEFMSFVPNDDSRKFTELYTVQRLSSSYVSPQAQVCISTISDWDSCAAMPAASPTGWRAQATGRPRS